MTEQQVAELLALLRQIAAQTATIAKLLDRVISSGDAISVRATVD